ncbi:VOC family protein [Chryseobacterium sp. MIQD13]|uniref:VOC family protein n=1 Tax=Chryseobacterium sp. MIQD13 TaxID=3422310 RepID=UPI003D2D755E
MKQVFINLPVEDLEKSQNFYIQLGFTEYPLFTGDNQKCVSWSENILVMLQTKSFFSSHISKNIADTENYLASTYTLPVENPDKVNEMAENGLKSGGTEPAPMVDTGFMQMRTIRDPDGHTWGIMYLDLNKFKEQKKD